MHLEDPTEAITQELYHRFPQLVALANTPLDERDDQTRESVISQGLQALAADITAIVERTGELPLEEIADLFRSLAVEESGRKLGQRTGFDLERMPALSDIAEACQNAPVRALLRAYVNIDRACTQHLRRDRNIQRVKDHLGPGDGLLPRSGAAFKTEVLQRLADVWAGHAKAMEACDPNLFADLDALMRAGVDAVLSRPDAETATALGGLWRRLRGVLDGLGSGDERHQPFSRMARLLYILNDAMKPEGQEALRDYEAREDPEDVDEYAFEALLQVARLQPGEQAQAFAFALRHLGSPEGLEALVNRTPGLGDATRNRALRVARELARGAPRF